MRPTRVGISIACAAACAVVLTGSQLPAASSQPPASGSQLPAAGSQPPASGSQLPEQEQLRPTVHAALPENIDDYWFAPRGASRSGVLAQAAAAYESGNYAAALT